MTFVLVPSYYESVFTYTNQVLGQGVQELYHVKRRIDLTEDITCDPESGQHKWADEINTLFNKITQLSKNSSK